MSAQRSSRLKTGIKAIGIASVMSLALVACRDQPAPAPTPTPSASVEVSSEELQEQALFEVIRDAEDPQVITGADVMLMIYETFSAEPLEDDADEDEAKKQDADKDEDESEIPSAEEQGVDACVPWLTPKEVKTVDAFLEAQAESDEEPAPEKTPDVLDSHIVASAVRDEAMDPVDQMFNQLGVMDFDSEESATYFMDQFEVIDQDCSEAAGIFGGVTAKRDFSMDTLQHHTDQALRLTMEFTEDDTLDLAKEAEDEEGAGASTASTSGSKDSDDEEDKDPDSADKSADTDDSDEDNESLPERVDVVLTRSGSLVIFAVEADQNFSVLLNHTDAIREILTAQS